MVDTIMNAWIRPTVAGVLNRIALKIPNIYNMKEFYLKRIQKLYNLSQSFLLFLFYFKYKACDIFVRGVSVM